MSSHLLVFFFHSLMFLILFSHYVFTLYVVPRPDQPSQRFMPILPTKHVPSWRPKRIHQPWQWRRRLSVMSWWSVFKLRRCGLLFMCCWTNSWRNRMCELPTWSSKLKQNKFEVWKLYSWILSKRRRSSFLYQMYSRPIPRCQRRNQVWAMSTWPTWYRKMANKKCVDSVRKLWVQLFLRILHTCISSVNAFQHL